MATIWLRLISMIGLPNKSNHLVALLVPIHENTIEMCFGAVLEIKSVVVTVRNRMTSAHQKFGATDIPTFNLLKKKDIPMLKTTLLFFATALAEILGCFLPYLWLRKEGSVWLLLPAAASLALFVWLLTLHPAASGRVYAAYGGVYVATALVWLRFVDGVTLSVYDWIGAGVALLGMAIIVAGWKLH